MDVHDPIVDLVRTAGDDLEELVAGQHGAGPAGEGREQAELAGREAAIDAARGACRRRRHA